MSLERRGPKHSTSVPSSVGVAVPLSVDVNKVASVVPNPVQGLALKALPDPQGRGKPLVLCIRAHSLPPTLQMVIPLMSPTLHMKVKVSPGHVGRAAVNCPVTSPGGQIITIIWTVR